MSDWAEEKAAAEISRLKRELSLAEAFHKVAVKERDYERALVARLMAERGSSSETTTMTRFGAHPERGIRMTAPLKEWLKKRWLLLPAQAPEGKTLAALLAVVELHRQEEDGPECWTCPQNFPCDTLRAIEKEVLRG